MAERYDQYAGTDGPDDDCPYEWISEWLCEYVDGTMDPSMQAVFEEYMQANPELAAHVERLCRTRTLLGECGCREEAADRARSRLHRQAPWPPAPSRDAGASDNHEVPTRERVPEEPDLDAPTAPLSTGTVVAVASAMTLMLGVGMVAGAVLFADRGVASSLSPRAATEQAGRAPDRPAVPSRTLEAAASGSLDAASPWAVPPLPLKKMPASTGDSVSSPHVPLLRQTGLTP